MSLSKAKGFTLVEVMVAVLVLAIGLLGLAHLQITSLKNNQSAQSRTIATVMAADILDKMRANQTAAQAGSYALAIDADPPSAPGTVAGEDIADWLNTLATELPNGDGAINCVAFNVTTPFVCDITITWREVQDDDDLGSTTFIYSGAL